MERLAVFRRGGDGTVKTLRCAIYTRKSSEEGLDQAFNSLHAQREALRSLCIVASWRGLDDIAGAL